MLANVRVIRTRAVIFLLSGCIYLPANSIYCTFAKNDVYMRAIKRGLIFSVIFCFPVIAFCWGMLGHRIVGEIADSYLTPKARAEVKKILGDLLVVTVKFGVDQYAN